MPDNPPDPLLQHRYLLAEHLTALFSNKKDCTQVINAAWKSTHAKKSGRPSLRTHCFDAIWAGLQACGALVSSPPPRGQSFGFHFYNHQTLVSLFDVPQGRLTHMIRARVSGISKETAKKYAQEWMRRDPYYHLFESAERRLTRYHDLKAHHPDLYESPAKAPRPSASGTPH